MQIGNGNLDPLTIGHLGERVVESRCLEHGLNVSKPSVDMRGADLIVNGQRVQVKSTLKTRGGYYTFNGGIKYSHRSPSRHMTIAERAARCDVFAFYAHDAGMLWLMPSEAARTRWPHTHTAKIRPDQREYLNDFTVFDAEAGVSSPAITPA